MLLRLQNPEAGASHVPPLTHLCAQSLSRVRFFAILWTVARQAPLSRGFSREEYWSELPCPPPGALPSPGIEPGSPALQVESSHLKHQGSPLTRIGIVKSEQMKESVHFLWTEKGGGEESLGL